MVRKLAQALEEAHYNGVVHRDLKPSNIMVNARGDLIIMDFGLVWRIGSQNERLTRVGLVVGTPTYMSPEQASGKVESIGPGCDIYSLGVIMYELLTGRVPFEGPEAFVLGQILFVEPPPPSTLPVRPRSQARGHLLEGDRQESGRALPHHGRIRHGSGRLHPFRRSRHWVDRCPLARGVAEEMPPDVADELAAETSPGPRDRGGRARWPGAAHRGARIGHPLEGLAPVDGDRRTLRAATVPSASESTCVCSIAQKLGGRSAGPVPKRPAGRGRSST